MVLLYIVLAVCATVLLYKWLDQRGKKSILRQMNEDQRRDRDRPN